MRIKRLELAGFKSFVDPTVIDFDAPIVGVVGPNGCGKSNVVDAIRWVMGEMSAKSLRGRAMEDVIFNGASNRPAHGMAEVSLTFSTEDGVVPADYAAFGEITITRRLYRSGESEYLINKIPSRLKDVVELFLGTGAGHRAYSVIEQGRIDFAINAKPEDRRLLIEEAAGISKFKARKEAALRKAEGTEQNLVRLKDILHEVTRQISSLDRQVKKAERYKILKNELRELELKLSSVTYLESGREITDLRALLKDWGAKEAGSGGELSTFENDLATGRLELTEKDRDLNALQEKYFEASSRLQLLEAQEDFRNKELKHLEEIREQALHEIGEAEEKLAAVLAEEKEKEAQDLTQEDDSPESLLLRDTQEEWVALESRCEEGLRRMEQLREKMNQDYSQGTRLEGETGFQEEKKVSLQSQLSRKEAEKQEAQVHFENQKILLQSKQAELEQLDAETISFQSEAEGLKGDLVRQKERQVEFSAELELRTEELVLKRSRLKSLMDLERNFEGYEEGVKTILTARKSNGHHGIYGVVAEFVETAPQYELAVSAVLGEKLQYVVTQGHEESIEAINLLKTQSSGRSSFIPLELRETASEPFPHEQPGVIGPLLDLVNFKEEYQRIGKHLLGDVVLVQSLNDAMVLWNAKAHKKTLVTLEGEVLDPSGVVSGGTQGIRGKLLLEKKREIKELLSALSELEEEIGLKEDTVSQLEGQVSDLELQLAEISRRHHEKEIRRSALRSEAQLAEENFHRFEKSLQQLEQEYEQCSKELEDTHAHLTESRRLQTQLNEARSQASGELEKLSEDLATLQIQVRGSQEKLTQLKVQAAARLERHAIAQRERERLLQSKTELTTHLEEEKASITEAQEKVVLLRKSMEESQEEKKRLKTMAADLARKQDTFKKVYEVLSRSLQEKEMRLKGLRKENDLAKSHTGDLRVTLSRVETELSHLEQQIFEKYAVRLSEFAINDTEAIFASPERIAELKEKLDRLGDVNLGSIPEYEELKSRQEFLTKQVQDLEESIDNLRKAIQRINQTTKQRFEETLQNVNERFQILFPRLFHGGRAELRLTDGEDLMNAGVELFVQPPGKKISHVGLLSGGEKAMSAIAFVFSIFLVRPSPFCILDEVDAPLDDLNITRFHNLLSEMVSRTQFILITHNRRTMERADLLYGVTMEEAGVSKTVSVRFSEELKIAS